MIDLLIEKAQDMDRLWRFLTKRAYPFRVTIKDGRPRSLDQNALQWKWASEAAAQREDMTLREIQNEWKLLFAVPILCAEDEKFNRMWGMLGMSYNAQLILANYLEVTSVLTVDQMKRYLDEVQRYNLEHGILLTDPEESRHGPKEGSRVGGKDTGHAGSWQRQAKADQGSRRKVR